MRVITSEQVSAGHPDKICDQIADAIVTDCLQYDKNSRVAIECLFKNRNLIIAGELTSTHDPDYKALVQQVFDRINGGSSDDAGLDYKLDFTADDLDIAVLVDRQSSDIALGVNTGGAGDQGMIYPKSSIIQAKRSMSVITSTFSKKLLDVNGVITKIVG